MAYKPVGADENGHFPPRVETAIRETIAGEISTPGTDADVALKAVFVSKGASLISVKDYYPNGYTAGVTDVKSAFDAAVAAAPEGSVVQFEPGANYFLTAGSAITKSLTLDLNGATFTVDPTPGTGAAGSPVFHFAGTLSSTSHGIASTAQQAITLTFSTIANASGYAAGDYIIVSDDTQILPWDSGIAGAAPIYPNGYTGREEINIVQSVDAGTGVLTLAKPTRHAYTVTPVVRKMTKVLRNPRIVNARKITEVDPGGLHTGSQSGTTAPHLIHFQYAENPVAEGLHFDGWNLHAVNFHRCINPHLSDSSGHRPYRPTDGGHGYLSRFERTLGGSVDRCFTYRVRHHTDYVMTFDASQSENVAVAPISAAYAWHGFGSKNSMSVGDAVEDAGAGWGWMIGNLAFNADYDVTIIAPRYSGVSTPIVFHAKAERLRVISPDVATTGRCVTVTSGATGLEITGGTLRTLGASASSNSLLVRDKAAASDTYGLRPGSVRMDGVRLAGATPLISLDAAGFVSLSNLIADELDGAAAGASINVVHFAGSPSALRLSGNRFAGNYANGVNYTTAAPAGQYVVELNDIRGYTGRATTLPAAANLRFIGNTANNNGGGLNPWNFSGDIGAAKNGAADYAAVVIGNSPRTLDEARVSGTTIAGPAGSARQVIFSSGDSMRWIMRATSTAETGSDAGSDFEILARTDAGGPGPQVFLARRNGDSVYGASGKKIGFYGSAGATKPTVAGSRTGETAADTSLRAALVALGLITDSTTA